ncbi:hypothetical protein PSHT_14166 [Puccinia striiformis]|uniref:ARID domain-containing protein n=1 Tax=Puccinia striiformis TaxID=27350 RepID=A0A2S4ULQ7_9BASI|nr:hypothetical protein PSHT_14166 [Puccinia striiformis]
MEPKFVWGSIRTEVPREFPKSKQPNRLFGLEHCPVFYPTIDEFKEPMKYFESIGPRLSSLVSAKLSLQADGNLHTDQFKFKTRLQRLNSMEASARANLNFLEQLYLFHKQRGSSNFIDSTAQIQVPVIDHRPVDLWRLRREINDMGGYDHITSQRKWSTLAKTMGYNTKSIPAVSFKLKTAYSKIIAPFDEYFNRIKQSPAKPSRNAVPRDRSPADSLSPLSSSLADHDEANRVAGSKEVKPGDNLKTDENLRMTANQDGIPVPKLPCCSFTKKIEKTRSSAPPIRRPSTGHPSTSHDVDTSMDHGGDICEICGSDEDDPNILLRKRTYACYPKILRCKYTDEDLQAMLMRVNSRSVKAGRAVDTSAIETAHIWPQGSLACPLLLTICFLAKLRFMSRRKPSTALLEATRAALPLARNSSLRTPPADNQEDQNEHSINSQFDSTMANESSIDCDENEKTEHGSPTSDAPTKSNAVWEMNPLLGWLTKINPHYRALALDLHPLHAIQFLPLNQLQ